MVAIITGDIVNSRKDNTFAWLSTLKETLVTMGQEPKQWEIFRGDSFQLETTPVEALTQAILIKASIKQGKDLDVRMAIGIGDKTHDAPKITEANGTAFINSGKCFETLKKKYLAIETPNPDFNDQMNLMFDLALLTLNDWSPATAETVKLALNNPGLNQKELGLLMGKSQSSISEALSRAGYEELLKVILYYSEKVVQL